MTYVAEYDGDASELDQRQAKVSPRTWGAAGKLY